jgi:hypothetical protein
MYLAFFERESRLCGKPWLRTLPLSIYFHLWVRRLQQARRFGYRMVRLFYIHASTYPLSQWGKEESILEQVQQMPPCQSNLHHHIMTANYSTA